MNLKEQLIQLKNKLLGRKMESKSYVPESKTDIKNIDLSDEEGKVVIGGKNERKSHLDKDSSQYR